MSIATVVTGGFGPGATIASVVTGGFTIAASVSPSTYPIKRSITWDDGQTPELVIGDTFQHLITLNSAGLAFDVSGASSIQACIVSKDHATQYSAAATMASDATGADWSTGDVIIYMTGAQTADIADYVTAEGLAKIEIQVEIGADKFSWFGAVRLVPGFIS